MHILIFTHSYELINIQCKKHTNRSKSKSPQPLPLDILKPSLTTPPTRIRPVQWLFSEPRVTPLPQFRPCGTASLAFGLSADAERPRGSPHLGLGRSSVGHDPAVPSREGNPLSLSSGPHPQPSSVTSSGHFPEDPRRNHLLKLSQDAHASPGSWAPAWNPVRGQRNLVSAALAVRPAGPVPQRFPGSTRPGTGQGKDQRGGPRDLPPSLLGQTLQTRTEVLMGPPRGDRCSRGEPRLLQQKRRPPGQGHRAATPRNAGPALTLPPAQPPSCRS